MWPPLLFLLLSTSPPGQPPPEPELGEISDFNLLTQGWVEDPALDLTEAIVRGHRAPVFENRDGSVCVDIGRWWGKDETGESRKHWLWASCPAASDGGLSTAPCHKLISVVTDLSVLGERCSKAAVAYAELELAGCAQGEKRLESLLRRGSSMTVHGPKGGKEIQELRKTIRHRRGPGGGDDVSCVTVVTSPDGRVRVWDVHIEQQHGAQPVDEETYRDLAYLQWLTPDGKLRLEANGAREDFFLDAVLDEIVPVPGKPHEYLVTGFRPLGFAFHRFAEVLSLEGEHPTRVKGRFLVEGQKEDVLIFTSGRPYTGKPRHALVHNHWLRLKGRRLWVEPISGPACCRGPRKPFVLGEWTGEVFDMKEGDWGWFRKLRGTKLLPGRTDDPWSSDQPP
ncbi:hypothetical protein LXT21_24945 [Myxococcus sp. K38C18041901]|uniref:hypothetical protein n=1 Tax=Myxococcus guangdongensis TaxID=2906760 RepID=UPI0020A83630|nr:hypothetical protein [Myxococcus guangdongensis]MCP3062037.1 hypothetical protein [Myxococcus guangdongensis]